MSPSRLFTAILSVILITGCTEEKKEPKLFVDLNFRDLGEVRLSAGTEIRCLNDANCASGYCWYPDAEFERGFCRDCETDADCPSGLGCDRRFCHMPCTADGECQGQDRCTGGYCRAPSIVDMTFCYDGIENLLIQSDLIETACSDGDCSLLQLSWMSTASPLELEPGGCTALRASLAPPDLGKHHAVVVVPTSSEEWPQLPLFFCAEAKNPVCAPLSTEPGCDREQPGCWAYCACDMPVVTDLFRQTSLGAWCNPRDNMAWACGFADVESPGYPYADDLDEDGIEDDFDNCPLTDNRDQADRDQDNRGDVCDNCVDDSNESQLDTDADQIGDVCDPDIDGDGLDNSGDNCPEIHNPDQEDTDSDALGNFCDSDIDGDQVDNHVDNCPMVSNPDQLDTDPITIGDACFADLDGDGVQDHIDNCVLVQNPDQDDLDGDTMGDLCDADIDDDGVLNPQDNCPEVDNPGQLDHDRDLLGDLCDDYYDESYCLRRGQYVECIDPAAEIQVRVGGERTSEKGETGQLNFLVNRKDRALVYEWTIISRPAGSRASIQNPSGMTSFTDLLGYVYDFNYYFEGWHPKFKPDKTGEYVIQVSIRLPFEDNRVPEVTTAVDTFKLTVE